MVYDTTVRRGRDDVNSTDKIRSHDGYHRSNPLNGLTVIGDGGERRRLDVGVAAAGEPFSILVVKIITAG